MISKEMFVNIIYDLQDSWEFSEAINHVVWRYNREFINGFGFIDDKIEENLVKLLSYIMHDEDDYINWWLYDCHFGQDNAEIYLNPADKNVQIVLDTPELLYDFLKDNYDNNSE